MNRRLDRTARDEALIRVVNERIEQVDKAAQEANYDRKETLFEFSVSAATVTPATSAARRTSR